MQTIATNQPSLFEENIALKTENTSLKGQITGLRTELDRAQSRIKHLESYLKWEDKLFATPSDVLPDAHKVIARALPKLVQEATKKRGTDENGRTRVYRQDVAQVTGKSEDRAGATLIAMHKNKVIDRELITIKDPETHMVTDRPLMVALTDDLKQARFQATKHHNTGNGQKFFVCKTCKSKNVTVRKVYEVQCMEPDCGEVTYLDPHNREDAAFILDEETFNHWEEMYGGFQDDQEPEPVVAAPDTQEPEPIPMQNYLRLPVACHCSVRSRWIEVNTVSHCTHCENEYRSYSA